MDGATGVWLLETEEIPQQPTFLEEVMPTKNPYGWPNILLLVLIGLISAYDTLLMVIYDLESIQELNPIALWILRSGGILLFVSIKSILTVLVLWVCTVLLKTKRRYIVAIIAIFQVCLFYYLTFTDKNHICAIHCEVNPISDLFRFVFDYFSKFL